VSTKVPEGQGVRGEPLYKSADLYVGIDVSQSGT